MNMDGFTALPECSRKAQTTPDRARYWLKLLGTETVKVGNVRYVPPAAAALLRTMARLISNGMTPGEAAKKARLEAPVEMVPEVPTSPPVIPDTRLEGIERCILALVDEVKALRQENTALRMRLEPPPPPIPEPPKAVVSVEPPRRSAPPIFKNQVRELSLLETARLWLDDCFGLFLGRG